MLSFVQFLKHFICSLCFIVNNMQVWNHEIYKPLHHVSYFNTFFTISQLFQNPSSIVCSKRPRKPYEPPTVTKVTSEARAEIILWPLNLHYSVSTESASSTAAFHLSCSVDGAGKGRFWTTRSPRHQWHSTLGINEDGCLQIFVLSPNEIVTRTYQGWLHQHICLNWFSSFRHRMCQLDFQRERGWHELLKLNNPLSHNLNASKKEKKKSQNWFFFFIED